MKLITFTVPCYNSEEYMKKCLNNLLLAGDEAEILIINDGSTDNTGKIADEYAEKYPNIVRALHQENGGHGEGVNQGLRNAKGLYFKVVDSDDWLDPHALSVLMSKIRNAVKLGKTVDMFVANYVYEHPEGPGHVMKYQNVFKKNKICTWNETTPFKSTQYLSMHSVIFRTKVLRAAGIELPKHTFYVDNLFVYLPLPYCRTIYYMDEDLYRYYIGRPDQSVQEKVLLKRVNQHYRVALALIDGFDIKSIEKQSPKLARVIKHHISMIVTITAVFLYMDGSAEKIYMCKKMWAKIKEKDEALYHALKYRSLSALTTIPGKPGRTFTVSAYKAARKIFKFN
ncbi:MAG: glycosyltransferase family 2 protein [Clostridia bacterium]|nr:glycosyltransferase family 2 protein [Clostridia bacterium]